MKYWIMWAQYRSTLITIKAIREIEMNVGNDLWEITSPQGPVVRKVDSAIHWIVIFSTAAEMHKKQ